MIIIISHDKFIPSLEKVLSHVLKRFGTQNIRKLENIQSNSYRNRFSYLEHPPSYFSLREHFENTIRM